MSAFFPNGSIFSLATVYAAAKVVTGITNANPGVASSSSHGYANGDIVLLNNPGRLDNKPVRVAGSVANAFNLEGIDTTSTLLYPAGFGVGTAILASTFVPLSQTTDIQGSGGEQQFYQWVYVEDGKQRQRPTFKNSRQLQLTLDWDPALPWHAALLLADQLNAVNVLLVTLPNGNKLYYGAYVSFDGEPTMVVNENMKTVATFSMQSSYTRYTT